MNVRRLCWLSAVAAIALSVCLPQSLIAQSNPAGGPAEATPAPSGQLKTLAVLAGAHYDKLIADIGFLGSFAGKPEAGQMAEGGLSFFTQGKGAKLIDKAKPWGLIVQTDGANFYPVGCLPITKVDDVLDIAKGFGAEVKDSDNGTKQLALPNGKSFYLKPQGDVVFISMAAASLSRLPADPQAILTKMVGEYDVSAVVAVQNIPEVYRSYATQAMQAGMQQGMKQLPNESDEQFADRQKLAEGQLAQMTRMINEVNKVTLGWAVDKEKQRTYLDFTYEFVKGSKMAERIAAYDAHTNFAGFYQPDAAATMLFATKADPKQIAEDLAQFESMMKQLRERSNREIDKNEKLGDEREAIKAAVCALFDALEVTIKEGHIDGGASVRINPASATIVAGMHVKGSSKRKSALGENSTTNAQEQSTRENIEQVLQADICKNFGATSVAEIVQKMRAIDTSGCPKDFQLAYLDRVHAWEAMAAVEKDAITLKDDSESVASVIESMIRGYQGDPFGKFVEIQDANTQLKKDYKAAEQQVRTSFNLVEKVVVTHGATMPQDVSGIARIESALKKFESVAKKSPDFPGVKWNAANHAGVNFHTLSIPIPEKEKEPRQLFGDNMDVAIGIGSDSVYLAIGRDNMGAINKAIDSSAADKGKEVSPFEFAISLKPIMEVAATHADKSPNPEAIKAVAEMLKTQAQGRDHLRLQGQVVPGGLKYHIEAEEGVLRAIGTAAIEAQKMKLQANQ